MDTGVDARGARTAVAVRGPFVVRALERVRDLAVVAVVDAVAVAGVLVLAGPTVHAADDAAGSVPDRTVARASVAVAHAFGGMAGALVLLLAAVTTWVLLSSASRARAGTDALFVARGATRRQLAGWSAAEGAVTGAVGAAVGVVGGTLVAALLGAPAPVLAAATVPLGMVALVTVVAAVTGSLPVGRRHRSRSVWSVWVTALVGVAAALFATWRLFVAGVPVGVAHGRTSIDVVAAAAPLVVVLGGAAVTVAVAGVVAGIVAVTVRRGRSLGVSFVARRLARNWVATAPTVFVVCTAVAAGVLVVGLSSTSAAVAAATARSVVGPDVRVVTDGDPTVDAGTPRLPTTAHLAGVTASAPVLVDTADAGSGSVPLVAVPARDAAAVLPGAAGRAVAATRPRERAGIAIPTDRDALAIDVSVGTPTVQGTQRPEAVGAVQLVAWFVDADGTAVQRPLVALTDETSPADATSPSGDPDGTAVATGSTATLTARVPSGSGWRLLAVGPDLTFSSRPADADPTVVGAPRLHVALRVTVEDLPRTGRSTAGRQLVDLDQSDRLPLGVRPSADRLPVVVTTALAHRLGLAHGDRIDVTSTAVGGVLHAQVAAVVPDVPGTGSTTAFAVDAGRLVDAVLSDGSAVVGTGNVPREGERWTASTAPDATAVALRARDLPPGTVVRTARDVDPGPVLDVPFAALGGAAAFAVVLAALVLGVGARTVSVRDDADTLSRLGVPDAGLRRMRLVELALPLGTGLVGGVAVGVAAVGFTAAPFGIASTPLAGGIVTATPVLLGPVTWAAPIAVAAIAGAVAGIASRASRPRGAT